jgi:NAD(P)-dependent dehydrogenase (short-subunit alcohol dehydrogenase family)
VVGAALGVGIETGAALLLYTTEGFLGTAGFLIALSLAALALGLWVGVERTSLLRRWLGVVIGYAAAAFFAGLWSGSSELRAAAWGGALAALFLLAWPAYTTGALLTPHTHRARTSAVPVVFGTAVGVLLAATTLIPRLPASVIFLAAAILISAVALWDVRQALEPNVHNSASMTNKVALITGVGNRGQVGFVVAQRMLAAGAGVCVTDVTPRVVELANELGSGVLGVQADLTDDVAVNALLEQVRTRFGRLDVLVNVAGGLSVIKPVAQTETAEWRREQQRNAETAFLVTRAALPLLREARGAIINFASPAGVRAQAQLGAYSAAKAAVVALTRAVAVEEKATGVRANAIAPGMIDTEQNRKSVANPDNMKWITREQIADVVLFLGSDAAAAVTGETIHVLGEGIE